MRGGRGYHAAPPPVSRRDVLRAAAGWTLAGCAPATRCGRGGPDPQWGVQSGDVTANSAVVWCRSDRASTMIVEWSRRPTFEDARRVDGPRVAAETDFVGKTRLEGLPPGTRIHFRARFEDGPWSAGSFGTAPTEARDVTIAWSGDTNGQGWGIDPARGGMPTYSALLARAPDLFVHCGDSIYADGPILPAIALPDGSTWNNVVDPLKLRVAQSLEELRGAHRYPRRSPEVRALSAAVPLVSIWDDHEVHNDWFPGELLVDNRYADRRVDALAVHARRAFHEHTPTLRDPAGPLHQVVRWGPLVDVFLLDGRTHRTPNEPAPAEGAMLGAAQAAWLVEALARSSATWKIVASNQPIGLVVADPGKTAPLAYDGWGNEDGPPREREVELARVLAGLRARGVKNVVWVTADVHYCAVHRFDPARAVFKDFDPFYELVAGPMHAASLPRKPTDDTFGPEVLWSSAGPDSFGSPADGTQYFGLLRADARTRELGVTFVDARGRDLHRLVLPAA